jgi:hypothetical protein
VSAGEYRGEGGWTRGGRGLGEAEGATEAIADGDAIEDREAGGGDEGEAELSGGGRSGPEDGQRDVEEEEGGREPERPGRERGGEAERGSFEEAADRHAREARGDERGGEQVGSDAGAVGIEIAEDVDAMRPDQAPRQKSGEADGDDRDARQRAEGAGAATAAPRGREPEDQEQHRAGDRERDAAAAIEHRGGVGRDRAGEQRERAVADRAAAVGGSAGEPAGGGGAEPERVGPGRAPGRIRGDGEERALAGERRDLP